MTKAKYHKVYRFRIYPTKKQEILINKTVGCSRFVYNYFLAMWDKAYKVTGKGLTAAKCGKLLTDLKKHTEWLREVDKFPLQQAIRDLNVAYTRFFKKQNDRPKFKSKKNPKQSYRTQFTNNNMQIKGNRIKLPKLGWVRFAKSREGF